MCFSGEGEILYKNDDNIKVVRLSALLYSTIHTHTHPYIGGNIMRVTHEESNHDSLCFPFVFSYVVVVVVWFPYIFQLYFSFVRSAVFLFARAYRQTSDSQQHTHTHTQTRERERDSV